MRRTPGRESMYHGLDRVRQAAKDKDVKFTALLHHVDAELLRPEGKSDVGTDDRAAKPMASQTAHHAPLAERALRRQTPEVVARCGNTARRDLCGGRAVTRVPTAIGNGRAAKPCCHARRSRPDRADHWTGRFVASSVAFPQRPFAVLLRPPRWKWWKNKRTRWCRRRKSLHATTALAGSSCDCPGLTCAPLDRSPPRRVVAATIGGTRRPWKVWRWSLTHSRTRP